MYKRHRTIGQRNREKKTAKEDIMKKNGKKEQKLGNGFRCSLKEMIQRNRNFFTLIELLITIAIIAILAGMLVPSLNAARESARDIACVGNMRQLGFAMLMYSDDHKRLPDLPEETAERTCWDAKIVTYLGRSQDIDRKLVYKNYICDSRKEVPAKTSRSYAMNRHVAESELLSKPNSLKHDPELMILLEACNKDTGGHLSLFGKKTNYEYLSWDKNKEYRAFFHKNRTMNFIRKDGAAQRSGAGDPALCVGETIIWTYNNIYGWYRNGVYFDK